MLERTYARREGDPETALARGLVISAGENEAEFPVTVWAVGTVRH